jgi:hypothetical protein
VIVVNNGFEVNLWSAAREMPLLQSALQPGPVPEKNPSLKACIFSENVNQCI